MKNILILTASTGAGHNQVAKTLEFALSERGHEVNRIDFIREQSKILEILIEDGYDILAKKFPEIYGRFYNLSNREWIHGRFSKMIEGAEYRRAKQLVLSHNPNLIIGTHPFSINVLKRLKSKGRYKGPFVSVVTDFEAHYAYVSPSVDLYITGSDFTGQGLIEKGIDPNRIANLGIPVSAKFRKPRPQVHPSKQPFTVLLMGGSMGLDPMKKAFSNLLSLDRQLHLIVVCGKNETLKNELDLLVKNNHPPFPTTIMGYTDKVDSLMDDADVIITKPGGITVSESLSKNLPMIVPYFIPGQEAENLDFLTLVNIAIEVRDVQRLNRMISHLMDHPKRLADMRKQMAEISKQHSFDETIEMIEALL